jgi:iron complex transport system ATP-binding protein
VTALLSVKDLSFAYKTRPVLQRVSFSVSSGAAVALMGANGSGKTTLLKLCAGLMAPQQGEVRLHGKLLGQYKRRELARRVALVPQEVHISFDFTVRQLVEQGRTPYVSLMGRLGRHDRMAVQRALELARVDHLSSRSFNELSGGERQRVKIALALAQEPELLMLDEPAQHLDIGRTAEIFAVLRNLNQAGLTIVGAIHDLNAARENFSAVLLLLPDSSLVCGCPAAILTPEAIREAFAVAPPGSAFPGEDAAAVNSSFPVTRAVEPRT